MLKDKVVLITGAGRGIGKAHALACAAAGASVYVNDLGCDPYGSGKDPDVAASVAHDIRQAGGKAWAGSQDVTDPDELEAMFESVQREAGRLDALISCAGVVATGSVLKTDLTQLQRVIQLQLTANFQLVQRAARSFIDQGCGGSIVLHSSPTAFVGAARQSASTATAAAILGLVRCAALELRKHRVRVNAIAPTARTRTTKDLPLFRGIADDSMGPEFVAPLAVFLASEHATEISGEILGVAGARLYAFRAQETPGFFGDRTPLAPSEIQSAWREITRP